ncbi:MAG: hypothetical protein AAGC65_12725 [Mucilaginibacter sp.]|uniref:hypothetical protein n=1 Tax=Mucilaginibacter sp. TaxID=1882438 RepID=UPI00319EFC49
MTDLEKFVDSVPEFKSIAASEKIQYFLYYHTIVKKNEGALPGDISNYFDELKLIKYSNIAQYLKLGSKKVKGKLPKFICQKSLYHLERSLRTMIDESLNMPKVLIASNAFFPQEVFNNTRGYLQKLANQAARCYDNHLFDACAVMTRKLLEVLIIEAFERYGISDKVKNDKANFYYLSDLIDLFVKESIWNIGRNARNALPGLKKLGDLSAHNRRYMATETDINKSKDDLRIVLEELIHLIDYPNWHPGKKSIV